MKRTPSSFANALEGELLAEDGLVFGYDFRIALTVVPMDRKSNRLR